MLQYTLTRLLYEKQEVKLSIVSALLEGKDYEEVIFWTTELYESGFASETWEILWKIYYDFYAIIHPRLERFIYERSISDNRFAYLDVTKNLFDKTKNGSVFVMRMGYCLVLKPDIKYPGRPPKWLTKYPVASYMLLRSIAKRNFTNICYYLRMWSEYEAKRGNDFSNTCRETLITYFADKERLPIKRRKAAKKGWKSGHNDRVHVLMALIMHCLTNDSYIELDTHVEYSSKKDISYATWLNEIDVPSHYLLASRREFWIFDTIGCFDLPRYNTQDIRKLLWFDWIYYASRSPLWKKRIQKHGGNINEERKIVEFENEDEEEAFHQDYGLEPDEQHKDIQSMSIHDITKKTWKEWFLSMFSEKEYNIISFAHDNMMIGY